MPLLAILCHSDDHGRFWPLNISADTHMWAACGLMDFYPYITLGNITPPFEYFKVVMQRGV